MTNCKYCGRVTRLRTCCCAVDCLSRMEGGHVGGVRTAPSSGEKHQPYREMGRGGPEVSVPTPS